MGNELQLKCPFCRELNSIMYAVIERREYWVQYPEDDFADNPSHWMSGGCINADPEIVWEEGFLCDSCKRPLAHKDILIIEPQTDEDHETNSD